MASTACLVDEQIKYDGYANVFVCFFWGTTRLHLSLPRLPLCSGHSVAKDALYQQAGRSKNQGLVDQLQNLEKHKPEEFLQHLEEFCTARHVEVPE